MDLGVWDDIVEGKWNRDFDEVASFYRASTTVCVNFQASTVLKRTKKDLEHGPVGTRFAIKIPATRDKRCVPWRRQKLIDLGVTWPH